MRATQCYDRQRHGQRRLRGPQNLLYGAKHGRSVRILRCCRVIGRAGSFEQTDGMDTKPPEETKSEHGIHLSRRPSATGLVTNIS